MRRSFPVLAALVCVLAIAAVVGCGGEDDGGSDTVAAPDPATRVSADQFRTGFAEETGIELTASDFPGDTVLLGFDDDGDPMASSDAETAFVEEFGTVQIYVVEPGGDPELILDAVTGESRDDTPVESGGDTVRLITNVAEPDADGVVWTRQCVRYEKQKSLNACSWTGTKRYGQNVIASWTATSDELDEASSRLDEAVSATVAGA